MRRSTRARDFTIAGVLLVTLLTGCGLPWPFPQPTPTADHSKLPDAEQIMQPLEIGPNAGDLATLDPALINFGVDYDKAQLIFPGLVTLDEQQRVVDWAAESHEVSSDGLTYTFHLRTGMVWSDGTPIDANTFAYAINRALDPCTGSDVASYLFNIKGAAEFNGGYGANKCPAGAKVSAETLIGKSIVVADPLTLKLTLTAPAGYFLASLTYPTSWAVPRALIDQHDDKWTEHLADNGGFGGNLFKLTTWRHPGQSNISMETPVIGASPTPVLPDDTRGYLIFTRNERFWGQKPQLKEIHYWLFQNASTAWETYKDGASDVGYPIAAAGQIDLARTLKGSTFHQVPQLAFSYITLNWTRPPFDDIRMRQAAWLALDRQAVAQARYSQPAHTIGSQLTMHFLPEGMPGYNADLMDPAGRKGQEALKPDLTTARRLANEYAAEKCAGNLAKCPPIEIFFGVHFSTYDPVLLAAQDSWRNAFPGWSVVEDPNDGGVQIKSVNIMVTSTGWGADYPDPQEFTSLLWTTGSPYNRSKASIPQVDQLCAQADGLSDLEARIPLYQQAEQLLVNQAVAIPYAQPLITYVVRSRVVNWQISPSWLTPLPVWQATYLTR